MQTFFVIKKKLNAEEGETAEVHLAFQFTFQLVSVSKNVNFP